MSSLYAKLIAVIEQKITPMAGAIGQQKYVTSIRDGFITALPFMIVGSFLLVFIFPPFSPDTTWGFARAWLQFSLDHRDALMLPFNFSMGVMTLFIAVGIAASLAKHHHLDSLTAGMLSLMSFLLVAAPLIPLFMAIVGWRAQAASEEQMVQLGQMNGFLLDRLRGLTTLRALGAVDATANCAGHTAVGSAAEPDVGVVGVEGAVVADGRLNLSALA